MRGILTTLLIAMIWTALGCTIEGTCGTWRFDRKPFENLSDPSIDVVISGQNVFIQYT